MRPGAPTAQPTLLDSAQAALKAGQLERARELCETFLQGAPQHPDALLLRGVLHHRAGESEQAERAIERALAARPRFPYAHFVLGLNRLDRSQPAAAVPAFRRALELDPNFAPAWATLGAALRAIGKPLEALAASERAIAALPNMPAPHCVKADALTDLGRLDEALACARQVVARAPGDPRTWRTLTYVLEHRGDLPGALEALERWRALEPGSAAADAALARLYSAAGRHDAALAVLEAAAARAPNEADVHATLGLVKLTATDGVSELGRRYEEAIFHCERALALSPDAPAVLNNLGNALQLLGRSDEAVAAYERVLALNPDHAEALNNLGNARLAQGDVAAALACFDRALTRKPNDGLVLNSRARALHQQGDIAAARNAFEAALAARPELADIHSNLLYLVNQDPALSDDEVLEAHRAFGRRLSAAVPPPALHTNARQPERILKIGYVSGDFALHPVGYLSASVLEAHDRAAVTVYGYSGRVVEDVMTARIRGAVDQWRATAGLSDDALADQVRADGIDILVDLSGHTLGNRMGVFARKPAPVQASWIGYFNTTGLPAIDYLLTDTANVPPGAERWFTEEVVHLREGRFCYAPPDDAPAVAPPPLVARGQATFGSFNNLSKLSPDVIELWAQVVLAVPDARLMLKWRSLADRGERERLLARFDAAGLPPARIELRPFSPHAAMLAEYAEVDVALDPFPFTGGLTSCEALWMGVPLVTLPGSRAVSRQGLGLLTQIGLETLAARDPADYVAIAAGLARDPGRLAELRAGMRARMTGSSLCDATRFTRGLEAAYRDLWRRWCAG